jgi:hypothetical protein
VLFERRGSSVRQAEVKRPAHLHSIILAWSVPSDYITNGAQRSGCAAAGAATLPSRPSRLRTLQAPPAGAPASAIATSMIGAQAMVASRRAAEAVVQVSARAARAGPPPPGRLLLARLPPAVARHAPLARGSVWGSRRGV